MIRLLYTLHRIPYSVKASRDGECEYIPEIHQYEKKQEVLMLLNTI